jgi:dihydroflavonol-4-reductase
MQAARFGLIGGEIPRFSSIEKLAIGAYGQFLNGAKAEKELGFRGEVDLKETIVRTLKWFSQNGYIKKTGVSKGT